MVSLSTSTAEFPWDPSACGTKQYDVNFKHYSELKLMHMCFFQLQYGVFRICQGFPTSCVTQEVHDGTAEVLWDYFKCLI